MLDECTELIAIAKGIDRDVDNPLDRKEKEDEGSRERKQRKGKENLVFFLRLDIIIAFFVIVR
jgi:hypothetical protein